MGAERINRLIREVVVFQERPQSHGHGAAPVGIAQEHDVVIIDAVDIPFQDRPGIVGLFFLGDLDDFLIVIGIDRSRADVEEVAAREQAQHLCRPFRIAYGQVDDLTADIVHAGV